MLPKLSITECSIDKCDINIDIALMVTIFYPQIDNNNMSTFADNEHQSDEEMKVFQTLSPYIIMSDCWPNE